MSIRVYQLAWLSIMFVVVALYWPGLNGPFILDDFGNLNWLGAYGEINSWERFLSYMQSFGGGPTGRPISKLTFLLNAQNWPAEPFWFKFTNLLIHLANATLLFLLNLKLLRLLGRGEMHSAVPISFAAAALWLVHPFLISTVLYPVQRMAQLSTFFVFLGLLFYFNARPSISEKGFGNCLKVLLTIGLITVAAVFSKENGILLPALLLLFELVYRKTKGDADGVWHRAFIISLAIAASIPFLYMLRFVLLVPLFEPFAPRDFSVYERVLTQSRALVDYLTNWFVPELFTSSVFQDSYQISKSVFELKVLFCIALISGCILLSLLCLRKYAVTAFAILFYFVAHSLESSVLMLELYFEHRNYLPASFLYLGVLVFLSHYLKPTLLFSVAVLYFGMLASFTAYNARIWSSYDSITEAAYIKSPKSARVSQQYSMSLLNSGNPHAASLVSQKAKIEIPENAYIRAWNIIVACKTGYETDAGLEDDLAVLSSSLYATKDLSIHELLIDTVGLNECKTVTSGDLRNTYIGMLQVPDNQHRASFQFARVHYLIGRTYLIEKKFDKVNFHFKESLSARSSARTMMKMAELFALNGSPDMALTYSNDAIELCCSLGESKQTDLYNDILDFQKAVRQIER